MDLRTYLDSLPHGGVGAFAESIGISSVYLSQLAARQGGRMPSPALCMRIENETGGAVTRAELRDDAEAIWGVDLKKARAS
jgi:DNA-binding transcriptional regulator YdaS (Cro superfamily)